MKNGNEEGIMEYKKDERDCKNCEFSKPLYDEKTGELYGMSCSKWECVKEKPDLDCALRE